MGGIAVILLDLNAHIPGINRAIDAILSARGPRRMMQIFRGAAPIFELELLCVPRAFYQFRHRLPGRSIAIYVENVALLGAIAKGGTPGKPAQPIIVAMWVVATALSTTLWFGRAPSATNDADLPTRTKTPCSPTVLNLPFIGIQEWLDYTNRIFTPISNVLVYDHSRPK